MGFFSDLFGKKTCCLCGAECGAMKREKIKNKEYVCNVCIRKCSQFVRVSEMDKAKVQEHIEFMNKRERLLNEVLKDSGKVQTYPSSVNEFGIRFFDNCGFFAIIDRNNRKNKENHEVIRYDEVLSYEYYIEKNPATQQNPKETFKEDGVKLKVLEERKVTDDTTKKGLHAHPFITREIKLPFRKKEKDTDYAKNCIQHFDYIFGVHSNETALFGGPSVAAKRDFAAMKEMGKLMGGVMKAAVNGDEDAANNEDLKAQMEAAQDAINEKNSMGLSRYSKAADEAISKIS